MPRFSNKAPTFAVALAAALVTGLGHAGDETPRQLRAGTLQLAHPLNNDIFRAGDVVAITGTVQGDGFQHYIVEWGLGDAPAEWFTTGVELADDGVLPVIDGPLATWDTASVTSAIFTTVRVSASFDDGPLEERAKVYLDPTLHQGWPAKFYADDGIGHFEPTVADLNNDRLMEIIVYAAGNPAVLHVYDHTGSPLPNWPIEVEPGSGKDVTMPHPAVGDMNNNGYNEIVVFRPKNDGGNCPDPPCVLIYNYDGEMLSKFPVAYPGFSYPGYCRDFATGKQELTLADIDADDELEIIILGEGAATILDNDGETLPDWPIHLYGWVAGAHEGYPSVGNFDDDDDLEIIIANDWTEVPYEPGIDRGRVHAFNLDASYVPGWPITTRGYSFSSVSIADLDGDGQEDVIVGFLYWDYEPNEYGIHAYDRTGAFLPGWPQLKAKEVWSNPSIADFDGNGTLEVAASDTDKMTHMFDSAGVVMPGWPQSQCWVDWYSPIIGDITGDGYPDVVTTNNLNNGSCSVYAWNHLGQLVDGFPKVTGALVDAPAALADLDDDGTVELIVTSKGRQVLGGPWLDEGCIYVWDMDAPYDATTMHWPMFQHDLQRTGRYVAPDEYQCPADVTDDGTVDVLDLLEVLSQWGTAGSADITGDGTVDVLDLLEVLSGWGPCE